MAEQTLSFGAAAEEYDARRPNYPDAALRWVLGGVAAPVEAPRLVVDLGAGTGILTRALMHLGHRVIPVEPDAAMRAQLDRTVTDAAALAGTAEGIPLPDGSVDAVMAGQAYHWFDPRRAHPEIARVLRSGGVFAPIWNIRDESVPWVARLTEIVDRPRGGDRHGDQLPDGEYTPDIDDRVLGQLFGPLFGPVERRVFRHSMPMTAEGLVALVRTRSYYITASQATRARVEQGVRDLAADLPETFELPYVTAVYRAVR